MALKAKINRKQRITTKNNKVFENKILDYYPRVLFKKIQTLSFVNMALRAKMNKKQRITTRNNKKQQGL